MTAPASPRRTWWRAQRTSRPGSAYNYDPDTIGLQRIEQLARQAGAQLTDRFGHLLWQGKWRWCGTLDNVGDDLPLLDDEALWRFRREVRGRLVEFPVILGLRDDKTPRECLLPEHPK